MAGGTVTIGVIPARYASTRLPAKPLVDLLGKPMVQRVYEQAKRAAMLDRVVVATDDARIVDAVNRFGGEVILTSPDIKSGSDRVAAVAEKIPGDLYVNVQGDEPLMPPQMIDEAVALMHDDTEAVLGTLARRIDSASDLSNPATVKVVVSAEGRALYFSRSPIPYVRDDANIAAWTGRHRFLKHIGLYVFRARFLRTFVQLPESALERAERLEQLRVLENGFAIRVGITEYDSIPVDTPADVERVITILNTRGGG
jgi:3-deoxy-manno-octulosonate cytidylyltransferase (CMP-KDO synthetase)